MSTTSRHAFEGRIWLIDELDLPDNEGPPEDVFWVAELIPMVGTETRPVLEWLQEDWREQGGDRWEGCGLDRDKNWQVLIKGTISGTYDSLHGEFDSEIEFEVVSYEEVPDNFLKWGP